MSAKKNIPPETYFQAWVEAGYNHAKAADKMGVTATAMQYGVRRYKRLTGDTSLKPAYIPPQQAQAHSQAPDGYTVKGVSTLVDAQGNVTAQWIKTNQDAELQRKLLEAAIETFTANLPRLKRVPAPKHSQPELLNLYTITDAHLGAMSWGKETGADWDLDIAEGLISQIFLTMIAAAPAAELGVVNQMGDYLHVDSFKALTPMSGHVLDADSRYQKIVQVSIRVARRIIDAALVKHPRVHINMLDANHDPVGNVWLRNFFSVLYESEPRVTVETSPSPYTVLCHGHTLLAFHHGHCAKKQSLPLLFAAKYSKEWGAATHRYCHVGHLHHVDEQEHPGMIVIQHPTLAAPDAYSSRAGYESKRSATCITYHKKFGQVARQTYVPEMLESAA